MKTNLKIFNILIRLISLLFLHSIDSLYAEPITGKVVSVADGDTITISENGTERKIRFYGIDCPEGDQQFGQQATKFTSALVSGRKIEIKKMDTDRYGRTVAILYADGVNLNEQIVAQGYGWMYRQYCKESFCQDWLQLESAAKASGKGLWADTNPTPPWEHRQQQRASGSSYGNDSTVSLSAANQSFLGEIGSFHGNTRSHVFHGSGCKDFNCPNCTVIFKTKQEAIDSGYRPHNGCVK